MKAKPVIRLPDCRTFQGLHIDGEMVRLQWVAHTDESWAELALPIPQARKLLEYLAGAYKAGRLG